MLEPWECGLSSRHVRLRVWDERASVGVLRVLRLGGIRSRWKVARARQGGKRSGAGSIEETGGIRKAAENFIKTSRMQRPCSRQTDCFSMMAS